jgi:hypothetical protein
MLEERIKRIQKSRPAPGVPVAAAPPPVQEPPQSASPLAANGSGLPRPGTNRNTTSALMRMRYGLQRFKHSADFFANSSYIIESAAISAS